jgi:hypothetical protein
LVEVRKAYRDRKAFEKITGKTLKKFRLAGDPLAALGIFPFFFIFGESGALCKRTTLIVKRGDWEDRFPGDLDHDESYIDILRVEPLTREEIRSKRDDPGNGFAPIATLNSKRFGELKSMIGKLRNPRVGIKVSRETKKLICHGLDASDEIRMKLGL